MSDRRGSRGGVGSSVWWRQLRSDAWADLAIAVVLLLTLVVVAAGPRVLEHASATDLAETIEDATPEQRNINFRIRGEIGAGPPRDPFLNIDVFGERLRDEHLPPSVTSLLSDEQWVFDTPDFVVTSFPDDTRGPFPTTFRFRHQEGIEAHSRIVEGSPPGRHDPIRRLEGSECPDGVEATEFEPDVEIDCAPVVIPVFEASVTRRTADDMMVAVGDLVTLRPSVTDLAFRTMHVDPGSIRFALRISGIVELDDPGIEYWYADTSLHRPRVTENADYRLVFAVGLTSPDQYRAFRDAAPGVSLDFAWRYLVDPELVERADAEALRDDVAKISPPDVDVITLLPDLLGTHLARRTLAMTLISISAVAVSVGALASIRVLIAVDGVRRRRVDELLVDRGASRSQLAVHAARTALAVVTPTVVTASLVAWSLFPDTSWAPTWWPVTLVACAAAVAIVAAGTPGVARDDRAGPRRIVAELLIVVAAAGSVALLRRRDASVDASGAFDTTIAVAPALLAVAGGLVVLHVARPIATLLARLAARRRTVAWFVGTRRLADSRSAVRAPIAVIAVATAAAAFATVVSDSLDRTRVLASWQQVGADVRLTTGNPDVPLPVPLQQALRERNRTPAFGATLPLRRFDGPSGTFVSDVVAIDLAAYAGIVEDRVLADLGVEPLGPLLAGDDAVAGLLVGRRSGAAAPRPGQIVELDRSAAGVPVDLVAATDRFPGIALDRPTIVVDRAALGDRTDPRTVAPTFALLDDARLDDDTTTLLDDPRTLVAVTRRADALADVADDPLSSWTTRSVRMLGLAGLLLAVVTAVAGAVITATERRRDLGLLAVLGLERGSTARIVAVELLPGVGIASVGGAVVGAATARLMGDELGLQAFAGGDTAADVAFSWPVTIAVAGGVLIAAAVAVGVTVRSARRIDHAMLLREGDR